MRIRVTGMVVGALLFGAGSGWAQVAWDAPLLVPPRAAPAAGLYLIDAALGDIGVMGTWRSGGPQRIGFRIGVAEGPGPDDVSGFGGVDVSRLLTTASNDFPLDIAWLLGAGLGVGDFVVISAPLALTLGRTFSDAEVSFTPFASPRVVLDAAFGDGADDLDLDFAFDIGLDLAFQPGWLIRFGGTFGDREAVGVGIVF